MVAQRKKNKKWIGWVAFLVLLVVAGVVVYFVWDGYFREKDAAPGGGASSQTSSAGSGRGSGSASGAKETENKDATDSGEVVEKQEVVNYEGENPNAAENLTGVVTYTGISGDDLVIRVNIDQYLTGGECRLVLKRGSEVAYEEKAAIVSSAATSTCEGFNIPTTSLAGPSYAIEVYLSADGKSGVILGETAL